MIALINLVFAVIIFRRRQGRRYNVYYSLVVFFIATWSFGLGMFYFGPQMENIRFWVNITDFSGSLIATFFLLFSFKFHAEKNIMPERVILILLPTFVVGYLLFFTNAINQNVIISGPGIVYGLYSFIFFGHFAIYMIAAFYNLFRLKRGTIGVVNLQMNYIIYGTIFTTIFAGFASMTLPVVFHNFTFMHMGPYFTIVMVCLFLYAMCRYEYSWDFLARFNKASGFV